MVKKPAKEKPEVFELAGRKVKVSSPSKVYFPELGLTKLDLVRYYLAVGEGALRGIRGRPIVLKRFVEGIAGDFFFQKRAPKSRPAWTEVVTLSFPSGRTADELVITDLAQLIYIVNLGCVDLNPHPVRADDLDHPDELRVDLDPGPGVGWDLVRDVAMVVREVLADHGLLGWPKTSGSRGIHVLARIERRWGFDEVRRAALALAREVERRSPEMATSKWWKEERHGVFLDYNQNAKDRTVASAYSVRPRERATVSAPVTWDEVPGCAIDDFTVRNMPERFAAVGDLHAGIDEAAGSLEGLLALSREHEEQGLGDAPWPPHYEKREGEPPRVQPSRARAGAREGKGTGKGTGKSRSGGRGGGRRVPKFPLLTIAKAAKEDEAREGLERWKARWPEAAAHLEEADVLVDAMRGRYTTWTRIRVNLRHVPLEKRPPKEPPDPDYDPWET